MFVASLFKLCKKKDFFGFIKRMYFFLPNIIKKCDIFEFFGKLLIEVNKS